MYDFDVFYRIADIFFAVFAARRFVRIERKTNRRISSRVQPHCNTVLIAFFALLHEPLGIDQRL